MDSDLKYPTASIFIFIASRTVFTMFIPAGPPKERMLLVFLHGSGGTGKEIRSYLDAVPLAYFGRQTFTEYCISHSIDVMAPTADVKSFTAMCGEKMNIWFDRTSKFFTHDGLDDIEDIEGVELSLSKILAKISEVESSYTNIFIGGHSMGGVLALHVLRKNVSPKFRGIFCIGSCLLNMSAVFVGPPLGTAAKLPLLMMHGKTHCFCTTLRYSMIIILTVDSGKDDDIVSCDWARKTASTLMTKDVDVQFKTYARAYHGLEDAQVDDLFNT